MTFLVTGDARKGWRILEAVRLTDDPAPILAGLFPRIRVGFAAGPPAGRDTPVAHHAMQVHGTDIVAAGENTAPAARNRPAADGLFTCTPGLRLAAKSADCLPVLFAAGDTQDTGRPGNAAMVMAVHAGWRGLTAGILNRAVELLARHGFRPGQVAVAIGPAISREAYEVGPEVIEAICGPALGLLPWQSHLAIARGKADRWHADLKVAASLNLIQAGIAPERLLLHSHCTAQERQWNSARRDGRGFGSNWSWIEIIAGQA